MNMSTRPRPGLAWRLAGLLAAGLWLPPAIQAQKFPITASQRATAQQVAQAGVPLADLLPDAPSRYTVQPGDTLWAISRLYLQSPWRWPELWGMNLPDIGNPHLIYPSQQLVLDTSDGRARLRLDTADAPSQRGATEDEPPTVRLSPGVRSQSLPAPVQAIAPVSLALIQPYLDEPLVVDASALQGAARLVAAPEGRVLLSRGDRAYARGDAQPMQFDGAPERLYRVYRNATPLRDPQTRAVIGYEAQWLGKVRLVRSESAAPGASEGTRNAGGPAVPATVDVVQAREEMRVGDRLLPDAPPAPHAFVPHAPARPVDGAIVSVHGSAVRNAGQNQIVVINRGTADGIASGQVLALLRAGERLTDRTDPARRTIQLPNERNGLLMVFRPFERVSYALVLEITDGVRVGDRVVAPQ